MEIRDEWEIKYMNNSDNPNTKWVRVDDIIKMLNDLITIEEGLNCKSSRCMKQLINELSESKELKQ